MVNTADEARREDRYPWGETCILAIGGMTCAL